MLTLVGLYSGRDHAASAEGGAREVESFLMRLAVDGSAGAVLQNQTLSALPVPIASMALAIDGLSSVWVASSANEA